MVMWLGILLGLPTIYVGWIFFRDPQRGYRIHNWPVMLPGEDGLTDAGKPPIMLKGLFLMAMGFLLLGMGLFLD